MTKRYALDDDSVVVVIGSGAGGGTIANELAQKGIDVVCLEAGNRLSLADNGQLGRNYMRHVMSLTLAIRQADHMANSMVRLEL